MNAGNNTVSDADLHAYVDARLAPARAAQVEAYLRDHPQAVARVEKYRQINTRLRELYDGVLDEPVPVDLIASERKPYLLALPQAATVAALMLLSGAIGWHLHRMSAAGPIDTPAMVHLVQPAAFAHAVYTTDGRYPVEIRADQQDQLTNWLSERLHMTIRPPNLNSQGFELVGGRLLPSTDRMAAQFMYEDADAHRITLYVRRGAWENHETAFHSTEKDGIRVFYWIDGPVGYALSGALDKSALLRLVDAVHQSLHP